MFRIKKKHDKDTADFISFRAVVNTHYSCLNIRPTPSVKLRPITTAPKGSRLTVYGVVGDWFKINYRGLTGYAYREFVLPLDASNKQTD